MFQTLDMAGERTLIPRIVNGSETAVNGITSFVTASLITALVVGMALPPTVQMAVFRSSEVSHPRSGVESKVAPPSVDR